MNCQECKTIFFHLVFICIQICRVCKKNIVNMLQFEKIVKMLQFEKIVKLLQLFKKSSKSKCFKSNCYNLSKVMSLYYVIAALLFLLSAILFCFYAMLCGLFESFNFVACRRFYNATDNSDEESGDN